MMTSQRKGIFSGTELHWQHMVTSVHWFLLQSKGLLLANNETGVCIELLLVYRLQTDGVTVGKSICCSNVLLLTISTAELFLFVNSSKQINSC